MLNRPDLSPELEDALRKLARSVRPIPDTAGPSRPLQARQVAPTSAANLLRVALPTALAASLIAAAVVAWPHMQGGDQPNIEQAESTPLALEENLDRIREAYASTAEAERILRAEFEKLGSKPERGVRWFEDERALWYRSPWSPRS